MKLGERQSYFQIYIAEQIGRVALKWVIPIYETEAHFILKYGIEKFDLLDQESEISLVEINRKRPLNPTFSNSLIPR